MYFLLKHSIFLLITYCASVKSCNDEKFSEKHFENTKSYMDLTLNPCDDFYNYACGNWHHNKDSLGVFEERTFDILKNLIGNNFVRESSSSHQKLRIFYETCVQNNSTKENKIRTYRNALKKWGSWPILDAAFNDSSFDIISAAAFLQSYGVNSFFRQTIKPNWKDSSKNIVYLTQPKFSFVSRNDLVLTSPTSEEYIFLYKRYIKYIMLDLGCRTRVAKEISDEIVDFETELAKIMIDEAEIEFAEPITLEKLIQDVPDILWMKYFEELLGHRVNSSTFIVVTQNDYLKKLSQILKSTNKMKIGKFFLFKFLFHFKLGLDEDNQNACLVDSVSKLGPVLGYLFINKNFNTKIQGDVIKMISELKDSYRELLQRTNWTDASTRSAAISKLDSMNSEVGFPDNLQSMVDLDNFYSDFELDPHRNHEQNLLNYALFIINREHLNLFSSSPTKFWDFNPTEINAYYQLTKNTLKIPATLIQPPIYHDCLPPAWNYGSLGYILGHEMSHGFDFEGRNYDLRGNIKDWWSTKSLIGYFTHSNCLVEHYNNYSSSDVAGLRTLSENFADNIGIRLSFEAFKRVIGGQLENEVNVSGRTFTNAQVFFISFAQIFCGSSNSQNTASFMRSSRHATNRYRVVGSLSHLEGFSSAFRCNLGSSMNPVKKCAI